MSEENDSGQDSGVLSVEDGGVDWESTSSASLNRKYRKIFQTGEDAFDRKNYGYAVSLFRKVLKRYPAAQDIREKLREAQWNAIGCKASVFHQLIATLTTLPQAAKARAMLSGNKLPEALDIAEAVMSKDCTATACVNLMATVLERAELTQSAANVLEWGSKFHAKDQNMLYWLANIYTDLEQSHKAEAIAGKLLELAPNNQKYLKLRQDAGARASMEKGKWTELEKGGGDFRTVVKDTDEAARLEQAGRSQRTEQGIDVLIEGMLAEIAQQDTVEKRHQLADLYAESKDFDEAIAQYSLANDMAGNVDPTIARKISNLGIKKAEHQIAQLTATLANLDGDEYAAREAEIAALDAEKDRALIADLTDHVRRFPTAADDRMQLAKILVKNEAYEDALGHLQTLARTPRFKLTASLLLGQCFMENAQYDMAQEQFESVIKGSRTMDNQKKDAMYFLGHCQRARGDEEGAMKTFKSIYSADLTYRDIRQLVEQRDAQEG